jgi:hypothetical protein
MPNAVLLVVGALVPVLALTLALAAGRARPCDARNDADGFTEPSSPAPRR